MGGAMISLAWLANKLITTQVPAGGRRILTGSVHRRSFLPDRASPRRSSSGWADRRSRSLANTQQH